MSEEFTPNPYWGDETVSVVAVEAGRGSIGLAVYRQPDGAFLEFVTTGMCERGFETPEQALRDAGYDARPVNGYAIEIGEGEWYALADMTRWPATSEKFSNGLAERAHDCDFPDETLGDVEGFGHFSLVLDAGIFQSAIVATDSQGFVTATAFDSQDAARIAWDELSREYERFCMAAMEENLPTGSCDGIFLIFDTARHHSSLPDRDEVEEHVRECATCQPYRYVLEEF